MHPDRAQQDHVEREAETENFLEAGQAIRYPADSGDRMDALCLGKHLARRIDGNDLKAPRHQPCCLSTAAASNIERKRRNLRESRDQPAMQALRVHALIEAR